MKHKSFVTLIFVLSALMVLSTLSFLASAASPNLVINADDIKNMRQAIKEKGRFSSAYQRLKQDVDAQISQPFDVPVPKDGGGGYTHERHKKNYQLMLDAAIVYQISESTKYAEFVSRMLLAYADLYPNIDVHPKRKVKSQNPGKLFWQSLNEAVWLVHTIQAFDLVKSQLDPKDKFKIEHQLLRPVALFLSEGQPSTFNKVHNHGTWATAGVGMTGYVLNEPEWVEKALYDLEKSGKGGFLKQLDQLFSPQGYYNEGPYYQRYALMPFVTFGKAIQNNEPERKIFEHRNGVLLKAINTTIQLSYNGLFFPINDAIKSKGIDTIELVHGVAIAYGLTKDPVYLDIAQQQDQIILSGDGLLVAQGLDDGLTQPYPFKSIAYGDGADGKQGALVILRSKRKGDSTVLFKPAAQGLGHGHFDKLTWQFYDHGNEIVSDYGAARFLNVEAKFGGRYLPENNTYAKQTVSHNTVVIDETSHFDGKVKVGNLHAPSLSFFEAGRDGSVASAKIDTAYEGVLLERTLALIDLPGLNKAISIDVFDVVADIPRQIDLPLHYQGQLIETDLNLKSSVNELRPLGTKNGYQHLWLKAIGKSQNTMAKVSWLNSNGRFYTQTNLVQPGESYLMTQIGANDPNFNLRNEHGFIRRVTNVKNARFVSVLEPHGEYNPSKEYTLGASSAITKLAHTRKGQLDLIELTVSGVDYLVVINHSNKSSKRNSKELITTLNYQQSTLNVDRRLTVFKLSDL